MAPQLSRAVAFRDAPALWHHISMAQPQDQPQQTSQWTIEAHIPQRQKPVLLGQHKAAGTVQNTFQQLQDVQLFSKTLGVESSFWFVLESKRR